MLNDVFRALDHWVEGENLERQRSGILQVSSCEIRVVGQTALLEAQVALHVPATMYVDVFANYQHVVKTKFEELLRRAGKELDPVGHEAWMPKETEYTDYFIGRWVHAYLAKPEYILISKAKMAPRKNDALPAEYLAAGPAEVFFELAAKYQVDLEQFVK